MSEKPSRAKLTIRGDTTHENQYEFDRTRRSSA